MRSPTGPAPSRPGRTHSARFGVVLLLQFALLVVLVGTEGGPDIRKRLDITSILIPLSAIAVDTRRRRERWGVIVLAFLAVSFSGGALSGLRPANVDLGPMLSVLCSGYTTWLLLRAVVSNRQVTTAVLGGALAAYIMAGLAFAIAYGVIAASVPGAFLAASAAGVTFGDLVYFSFVTLLTIGFGDVTPVAPLARAVVVFEGLFGVLFTTVVMASLVAGYLRDRREE
jgi:hypothetical protein